MISARVVAHTSSPAGSEALSFILTYPRYIHAEFMTHRVISRNAASSRAIPVRKMLASVWAGMAEPIFWGANQAGMQANAELSPSKKWLVRTLWRLSGRLSTGFAWLMDRLGAHKQIVNRVTEPYSHITVLATGTDWGNFFNLRCSPEAEPSMQALAYAMLDAYEASRPSPLREGEWHLPFADRYLAEGLTTGQLLKITTARAARLSYLTFEGDIDHEKDYALHDRLAASGHWSCFEHALRALAEPVRVGNVLGYFPYRKMFPRENLAAFNPAVLRARRRRAA